MNPALLSSDRMDWETPPELFEALAAEFGPFDLDAAATHETAKCARYYTPEVDGLSHPWAGSVWLNPPYGREIGRWVRKAYEEARAGRATVTLLIPARTDTAYWHDYVMKADTIRFLRGRVRFLRDGQAASAAPVPERRGCVPRHPRRARGAAVSVLAWTSFKAEQPPRGEQVLVHGVMLNELVLARLTRDDGVDWWEIGVDYDWRGCARPDHQWTRIPLPTASEGQP